MNNLIDLLNNGVTSIEPYQQNGIRVSFDDKTNLWIEHNLNDGDEHIINIWGTSVNGGTNTRVILDTHTLTKAKLIVQELTAIIEKLEAE